ncbi:MAG: GNAT family N-acetyltransferase [Gammaproteobacteria bacterium]
MSAELTTSVVSGAALKSHIDELARLRITVFKDYPYLYDGDIEYEANYLATYTESPDAMAVIAFDGERVVGVSTGIPMSGETDAFKRMFLDNGYDPSTIFYCGESVLLAAYRGRGLYRRFFDGREAYARALDGVSVICFCGVVRSADHPLRPKNYVPLDSVWRHFGYEAVPGLVASLSWKDIDRDTTTEHPMQFWLKSLIVAEQPET